MGGLLEFTGRECDHCNEMDPLVEKLEKELKIKVEKLEVWHNSKNAEILRKLDNGKCGGIPFFFNENTKKFICGATSYEKLKAWALGK
ncbi:MAG TPA: thioredoxin domain-containing protein [Candidatus Nanoarchaeia archaeon]|nr:thioredoxin domain-containing protein [Candidatus Nanoarchaeia archaeon]